MRGRERAREDRGLLDSARPALGPSGVSSTLDKSNLRTCDAARRRSGVLRGAPKSVRCRHPVGGLIAGLIPGMIPGPLAGGFADRKSTTAGYI